MLAPELALECPCGGRNDKKLEYATMINPARSYNIDDYIEILRRRIWYLVIPFLVIMIGTAGYAKFAPRLYKASTLVLVTPQKVPEAFVHPTVTSRIEERLQSIAQEVMSRTRLEQVIKEFGLYKEESNKLAREEVVELMQKNIKVELPTKKDEKGYFTIGYIGKDPNVVTAIANRLASLFIEENLRLREQQAVGTTEFLATELAAKKTKLEELEAAITQYKRQHMGELPEQRDTNLKILEQLQNQYQRVGENLRAAQDRKLYLQKQMSDLELPITDSGSVSMGREGRLSSGRSSGSGMTGTYESQKDSLTKQLEDLRSKYTESHPDVIVTKKKLADLETKKDIYDIKKDPRYRELRNQLSMTDIEIRRLHAEEASIGSQMNRYRGRIENVPSREQEMALVSREYQNTKETYEQLLKKSQDAQQAENLERRQKGEQFRVIDPARVPEKPFSPDIPKVLLIGFVISIGCGFGSAIIREQMDRSFHDAGDVEVTLGLRVMATIPKIEEKAA
jgi:polysaccharide chain length determinant protein (PEP-CTERM system associated)